jgi:hypothetical protein
MLDTLLIAALALAITVVMIGEASILRAMLAGFGYLRRQGQRGTIRHDANTILKSPLVPSVSVIAAPPDASEVSLRSVHDLAKLHYGDHEVLVVLDGPSESELAVWIKEFQLFPSSRGASGDIPTQAVTGVYESRGPFRLMIIEKEAGGLADCLNVGLNVAGAQLVGVADPRSTVAPETLLRLVVPFLEQPDVTVAACTVVPSEGSTSFPAQLYALECTRLWLGRAAGLAARDIALPPPGTFALIERSALRNAHGFAGGVFEMIFHLHAMYRARNARYHIAWLQRDLCSPIDPSNFRELWRATVDDQRETSRTIRRHLPVLGSLSGLGRIAMPGLILTGLVRPLAETVGLIAGVVAVARGTVPSQMLGLLVVGSCVFGTLNSMTAVLLREASIESRSGAGQLFSLFFSAIPENFGYRQIRNVWRLTSFLAR